MIAISAYHFRAGPAAKGCIGQLRDIEKTSRRKQFDGEYEAGQSTCSRIAKRPEGSLSCQYGTSENASFWNGPRLRPGFAAQVLGQAMKSPLIQNPSAYAAYRSGTARTSWFFDQNF